MLYTLCSVEQNNKQTWPSKTNTRPSLLPVTILPSTFRVNLLLQRREQSLGSGILLPVYFEVRHQGSRPVSSWRFATSVAIADFAAAAEPCHPPRSFASLLIWLPGRQPRFIFQGLILTVLHFAAVLPALRLSPPTSKYSLKAERDKCLYTNSFRRGAFFKNAIFDFFRSEA